MSAPSRSAEHKHTNRLAKETSPYLLQHAHNPVDWYPWGPEALEAARRENKPIFLSVGYSTCYWCHVMERQSFENEQIAAEMNERFVNIKVDREERPDVDQLYMTAVQVLTRHGGWPMSVWLTPELKPFYGGTYFPPTDMHGRPGFLTVMRAIEGAYRERPGDVAKTSSQLEGILRQLAEPQAPDAALNVTASFVQELVDRSVSDFDPGYGGFGGAPKFPRETLLEMMLVSNRQHPSPERMKMLRRTLDAMAEGGMRDQLGGGFHRYSTDPKWLVPHFEIMLYDDAMLAYVYADAYQQTRDVKYAAVARGVLDYTLREMKSPDGAFFTAYDAEVDALEGGSYLWTQAEVEKTLRDAGTAESDIHRFLEVYGLDQGPNFADPHHGSGVPDANVLYLAKPTTSGKHALLDPQLALMRQVLYEHRKKRKQPLLDTKVITSWNALMIRAMAYAGRVLEEPKYAAAAARAADYLLKEHVRPDGSLWRTSRDGVKKHDAFLDDYSFLAHALIELAKDPAEEHRRDQAQKIVAKMTALFGDEDGGGFYFSAANAKDLIVRQKVASDSPLPSGNAVAAMVLMELGDGDAARKTIAAFAGQLEQQGEGMSSMIEAALLYLANNEPFIVAAEGGEGRGGGGSAERPISPEQLAAAVTRLQGEWRGEQEFLLHVGIAEGFHLNAHDAAAGLVGTNLSVAGSEDAIAAIDYPPGELRRFAFADEELRVYEDEVTIAVRFKGSRVRKGPLKVALSYQACNEDACLAPITKQFEIPSPDEEDLTAT
jgi:hypothetical protein